MTKKPLYIASGLLLTALTVGCSSGDTLAEPSVQSVDGEVVEERYGALLAEFVYPREWGAETVEVQAQFLDARGVAVESALDALEVWMPRRGLEMADCQFAAPAAPAGHGTESSEPVSLHLLDVGDITVVSPQERLELPPRRLPDLLSSFYGVVYGSEWSWDGEDNWVDYYPGVAYRFSAPGTSRVGGFDLWLNAPEPILLAAANGDELRDRSSVDVEGGQDLELIWDVSGFDDAGVEVFIDLVAGYGPERTRLQCRADDNGAFTVPSSMIRAFQAQGQVDLELRRVRRSEVAVDGLDSAHFHFVTTDRVELRFQ